MADPAKDYDAHDDQVQAHNEKVRQFIADRSFALTTGRVTLLDAFEALSRDDMDRLFSLYLSRTWGEDEARRLLAQEIADIEARDL